MKRTLLIAILALKSGFAVAAEEGKMVLVKDGKALSSIVVDAGASEEVQKAARTLQKYVEKSTGVQIPLRSGTGPGISIHLGASQYVNSHRPGLNELDVDAFVLGGIDDKNYLIAGGGDWGTEFGVYEFLERYLGVRWLMPGDFGEDVPKLITLEIPVTEVRQEPVYLSRDFTKSGAEQEQLWARRNRLHRRVSSGHNMLKLFPVAEYGETRPDFYPLINGVRLIPPKRNPNPKNIRERRAHYKWQPNFTAPGIVEATATKIDQYFKEDPAVESFELGLNDGNDNFDQSEESLKRRSGKKNSMGYPDASDDYFLWANAVVEKVSEKYPEKWFSTLAYRAITDPPAYAGVNERIVPYLTQDRHRWIDPKQREADQKRTLKWADATKNVGWYDYSYGISYYIPRVYPHVIGEYLKWGADHHVRFLTGEHNPNWGEGPKAWLIARLTWNPNQDVDALLNEWYERTGGLAAAPMLKEYYEIWEKFWTQDILKSKWWHAKGPYLTFANRSYLLEVPEEYIKRSDRLLNEAFERADTPQRRERVANLRAMWETWYKPHLLLAQAQENSGYIPQTENEALKALDEAGNLMVVAQNYKETVKSWQTDDAYLSNPFFGNMGGRFRIKRNLPPDYGDMASVLWRVKPWIEKSEKIREQLESMIATSPNPVVRVNVEALLASSRNEGTHLLKNPSFEDGLKEWQMTVQTAPFPSDYPFDDSFKGGRGTFSLDSKVMSSGTTSLQVSSDRIPGTTDVQTPATISQSIPYEAGEYYTATRYYMPIRGVKTRGVLSLHALDSEGKAIQASLPTLMLNPIPGQWAQGIMAFTLPPNENAKQLRISIDLIMLTPIGDFDPKQKLSIDDVDIIKLK